MGMNTNGKPNDRLFLVRAILDIVNGACRANYVPPRDLSVDEAMIAFRGRSSLRQYMPAKPTKYGIKVWSLSVAQNGYCSDFAVYLGKPENGKRETDLGKKVVLEMTRDIGGKNHHIFFDNYFCSMSLLEELLANGIYGCGTIKSNRAGLPSEPRPKTKNNARVNLQKTLKEGLKESGNSVVFQKGPVTALAWLEKKSRKPVLIASSNSNPLEPQAFVNRRQKNGDVREVHCPRPVKSYNANMNGVDRTDQMRTQYVTTRMSRRWWTYISFPLLDLAVANSFMLMLESPNHRRMTQAGNQKEHTMLEFRMALAKQMIKDFRSKKRNRSQQPDAAGAQHWPQTTPTKRRCKNCLQKKRRSESRVKCKGCSSGLGSSVNLCTGCFEEFHKKKDN